MSENHTEALKKRTVSNVSALALVRIVALALTHIEIFREHGIGWYIFQLIILLPSRNCYRFAFRPVFSQSIFYLPKIRVKFKMQPYNVLQNLRAENFKHIVEDLFAEHDCPQLNQQFYHTTRGVTLKQENIVDHRIRGCKKLLLTASPGY